MKANQPLAYIMIFVFMVGCNATDEYELKFDLTSENGNTYICNSYHTSSLSFLQQSRADTVSMCMELNIDSSTANQNKINIVFKSIDQRTSTSKRSFALVDSRKRTKPVSVYDFRPIVDSVFAVVIDKRVSIIISNKGTVEKVNGIDELISSAARESHQERPLVRQILNDYISENALKDQFNRLFSTVSNKKVKLSDNWANDFTLIAKAPVHVNSVYTLKQFEGDSAYVDIQSKLLAGTAGNFYLNGTQTGLVILNYYNGLPYLFESFIKTTTTTNHYDVNESEHWLIMITKMKL